ncbi:MAG: hypothetical protein IPH37_19125 [Burkholderiales bacterium]|nr:hypothetical protein [Burkholderiales bacterium]
MRPFATCNGELCATLEGRGVNHSDFDMMIAAHAAALDVTLVAVTRRLRRVPQGAARLEIW